MNQRILLYLLAAIACRAQCLDAQDIIKKERLPSLTSEACAPIQTWPITSTKDVNWSGTLIGEDNSIRGWTPKAIYDMLAQLQPLFQDAYAQYASAGKLERATAAKIADLAREGQVFLDDTLKDGGGRKLTSLLIFAARKDGKPLWSSFYFVVSEPAAVGNTPSVSVEFRDSERLVFTLQGRTIDPGRGLATIVGMGGGGVSCSPYATTPGGNSTDQTANALTSKLQESFKLGIAALNAGNYAEAIQHLRRASELGPSQAAIWANLGEAYSRSGDPTGAVTCYRKAVGLAPQDSAVRTNLAIVLDKAGDQAAALAEMETAAQLAAGDAEQEPLAQFNFGAMLHNAKRFDEAYKVWQQLIQKHPQNPYSAKAQESITKYYGLTKGRDPIPAVPGQVIRPAPMQSGNSGASANADQPVAEEGTYVFVDKSGKSLFGLTFSQARPFSEGLAWISTENHSPKKSPVFRSLGRLSI
jgi:tetratricopeptide (TPR) repeat protein